MVVLRDANVESIGEMAELPPDLSPFQRGTTGEWDGSGFQIVGRVRVEWDEGSWNEWCLSCDATRTAWLAEAQGLLMISFAVDPGVVFAKDLSQYNPGDVYEFAGRNWTVTDVKEARCIAGEGELPFAIAPGEKRTGIDFSDGNGGFASVEFSEEGVDVYVGSYAEFDALKFANLRPVPGWDAGVKEERNRTSALACPHCGAAVNLRAAGLTMAAMCGSCGTLIDTANPNLRIIQKASSAQHELNPLLPIGQRGNFSGHQYEVIGFVERRDQYSRWGEYLLFNPWQGFQWLVNFQGHWTFVTRLPSMPDVEDENGFTMDGHFYRLFAKGKAEVKGVLGEFYWKVRRGEKALVSDYVAPPFILSKETYPGMQEVAWSRGVYIKPALIEEAFGVKSLPSPDGTYLNEPNPYKESWDNVKLPYLIVLCALVGIQIFFGMNRPEVQVANSAFQFKRAAGQPVSASARTPTIYENPAATPSPGPQEKVFVTPHFQIEGHDEKVEVEGSAGVDNSWLDLDIDLVNAKTNQAYPAPMEISYYHGYDDGAWSEGSQVAKASISGVPPGEYFLSVSPDADPSINQMEFNVRARRGGVFFSNLLMSLCLVSIYPLYLFWRSRAFEGARWAESDFNPNPSSDSEDDDT